MSFEVVDVSRGDIHLEDGADKVRVLGEGLIPADNNAASFVVYLNSFLMLGAGGWEKITHDDKKAEIVASIKSYFKKKSMVVDFE
ncbi:Imm74 family immunity protein [Caballeronia sordidicola]|jgi:hypothetical protein|uniref:Imm74 family immunity protein n=1 Tax=Caballeronia sordidicola TaxID=196367 RepID=UPI000B78020E|nr:Imm74 family immunity protein [Caballeronia sordidicola]